VVLIARGQHLEALRKDGLRFVAPDGDRRLSIPAVGGPAEVAWQPGDVVVLTMKSQHTVQALDDLAAAAGREVPVVCGQNGVANERMALRRFSNVHGMLVNLPAIHLQPGEVVTHADGTGGILDTGRYPEGSDSVTREFTAKLTEAGFSSRPDDHIMRKKYAKLLGNLGNIVQAATADAEGNIPPGDDETAAMRDIFRRLRGEALACFEAAGIDCASRDEVRARHENTYRMVEVSGFGRPGGSSWQSLNRGTGNVETDYLNGEVTLLGALHGVPTPANRICQELATKMVRDGLPVGSLAPTALLEMMAARDQGEV
jgi:2-dehydropantoate 2-reductase